MSLPGSNFYAAWCNQHAEFGFLHENQRTPPERLVQAIWHHQRLRRDQLQTADGKRLRILHPGFWNHEAGPDFRNAIIQIGSETRTGDVEIDLASSGWRGHGHDRNPNFKNVILHVVWDTESTLDPLPLFVCNKFLDASLAEITSWLGSEAAQQWPRDLNGQCCAPLRELPADKILELLRQAALVRFQRKALEMEFRARQAGWEQALWESLLRALGYKQNIWPMRRIAELLPHMRGGDVLGWQARLLGVSGLLPDELPNGRAVYQRQLWDIWWRERESFTDFVLPKGLWKFSSLRPANHPQRRLALAGHWLASKRFLPDLERWFTTSTPKKAPAALVKLMQVESDTFWSRHWTFRSAQLPKGQPLIGDKRITDLAINVILPWFWMRAVTGKNTKLRQLAEEHYFSWPAAEDNSVLRLARHRLLNDRRTLRTAADQQGLLQIVRDFCEHSDALCTNCRFPDLVRQWNAG